MDYYGTYLHPHYAESMQAFKRDYYKEMLLDAIEQDDKARVHQYAQLLKRLDQKSDDRSKWTSSETWSRVGMPQTTATQ